MIDNTEVLDGQVLFNTDTKTILLDDNNTREEYGGGDESNKNLAIIEEGEVATRGYAKGTYIIWQEQLYKVLSQINSGDSFVVNQNISEDTVGQELTQVQSNLTASDNLEFKFGKDATSGKYGYYDLNGTFIPFKEAHTGTYIATARSASLDMGENHTYRYVNTNSVPNTNSGTFSVTSNGTHDMGATNSYRYVNANIPLSNGQVVYMYGYSSKNGSSSAYGFNFNGTLANSPQVLNTSYFHNNGGGILYCQQACRVCVTTLALYNLGRAWSRPRAYRNGSLLLDHADGDHRGRSVVVDMQVNDTLFLAVESENSNQVQGWMRVFLVTM